MNRILLGFEPGGHLAFGWCAMEINNDGSCTNIQTGSSSVASEALTEATAAAATKPSAIGVNAPMYWSTGAERIADQILRGIVLSTGGPTSTVVAVNALPGVCLAQGVVVAALSRERWPDITITESHPKALLHLCPAAESFLSILDINKAHQRMAVLAAYTAWKYDNHNKIAGDDAGWQDLRKTENNTFAPIPGPSPAFWFPTAAHS